MKLLTTQAIYSNGRLIFADPESVPRNGAEVVVTFLGQDREMLISDLIEALRGRGKGEQLVEKLLHLRHTDRDHDERAASRLRP